MKGQIFLLCIPLLFSCASQNSDEPEPTIPEHSYSEVYERTIKWEDSLSANRDNYCVYYFSRTCKYCEELKNEVIEIALTRMDNLYFCNDNEIIIQDLDPEITVGVNDVTNLFIRGFPSLIEVTNNTVKSHFLGRNAVITFLRSLA